MLFMVLLPTHDRCPRIVEIIVQSLIQNSTVHDRVLEILASITPEILEIFHTDVSVYTESISDSARTLWMP